MSNVNYIELEVAIDKYINSEEINADNAQQAISEFNENWKTIVGFVPDINEDGQSKYGLALHKLSVAYFNWPETSVNDIRRLSNLIEEYDNNEGSKFFFYLKWNIYYTVASCWHKMGTSYDSLAIKALKKYIFYRISPLSHTRYCPTAYVFKKCDEFLYQALVNKQLNLSSPAKFNDPFDCPILGLLELEKDYLDLNPLIKQAYSDCLKIACFTSNVKLTDNKKKQKKCEEEFLKSLMWAHYADKHKGICIKYKFNDKSLTKLCCDYNSILAFFGDVKYYDGDMNVKNDGAISLEDAFFYKSKQWEYENELRYFYYDVNGKDDYATVDISNCAIEAIYFGLDCSKNDEDAIQTIMKDKNVQFYKMKMDKNHFGQLKSVPY